MAQKNPPVNRSRWLYVLLSLAFLLLVFFFSARERLLDTDEGPYLIAAKLVMEGKLPYTDFFWPQMPLLPYAYGLWMKIFGTSWYAARYFSGLLGVAMGLLVFFHLVKWTGKPAWGLFSVLLFATTTLSFGWFATTKTYPLSTFLLLSAYLSFHADRLKEWKYLLAGALLGLAISARLYFLPLIPVFFYLVYREEKRKAPLQKLAFGLLVGLAPAFFFLFQSPDHFFFDNVGYHFRRSNYDVGGSIGQKFEAFFHLVGVGKSEGFIGWQVLLLFLAAARFLFGHLREKRKLPALTILTAFLIPVLFIPTPVHLQYFSSLIPFLILQAVLGMHQAFLARQRRKAPTAPLFRAVAAVFLGYAALGAADFYKYARSGVEVPGVRVGPEHAVHWTIETIRSISREVNSRLSAPGEPVLAIWPGYLLESKGAVVPKMENQSNVVISPRLSPQERERYRIISGDEILRMVQGRQVHLFVLESWTGEPTKSQAQAVLRASGYHLADTLGGREIYQRSEGTP